MFLKKTLDYLRWPVVLGLLAAAFALILVPGLRPEGPIRQWQAPSFAIDNSGWQGPVSYADAVSRAAPSVVNIYTDTEIKDRPNPLLYDPLFRRFFNNSNIPQRKRMQLALGSGVIISEKGYLLTNNHVIRGASVIIVSLIDGRDAQARVIGVDKENDLAVLKIDLEGLQPISIGSAESIRVGDVVLAIGNPYGKGQTVTQGIISATGRRPGINYFEDFIQTDATINPGNSGGALIDAYGNLIGINSAKIEKIGNNRLEGVGLAVPADTAIQTLNDIVEYGRVVRGWLGVEAQPLKRQKALSLGLDTSNGVEITGIYLNGPAHLAGLKMGDVIVRINQQPVGIGRRGAQEIAESRPGETVQIDFIRSGQLQSVEAVLASQPTTG